MTGGTSQCWNGYCDTNFLTQFFFFSFTFVSISCARCSTIPRRYGSIPPSRRTRSGAKYASRNGTWPSERTCPLESNRHKWVLTWEWPNLEKIENQKNSENTSPAFLGYFNCCLPECNGCEYVTDIWLQGIVVTWVLWHGTSDSRRQKLVEGDGLHLPDENFPGILEDFFVLCLSQMRNRKKKSVDAKN